ncbi:MAG TPA: TonB-dependent receptor [Haliscomenobacter sp.]|nr:TonB-dependent receptor [Haliscomenobacter sp.]
MKHLLYLSFFLNIIQGFGQSPTQIIRGIVRDKDAKHLLIGASVEVVGSNPAQLTITDENGAFVLENVKVGRVNLRIQYLGYEPLTVEDIILQSTKESYQEFELSEGQINIDEVVVNASKNAFEAVNPSAVVSTRSFTAEETDRIPAGANDPGRVALSYPGVQRGENDTENQIVVRGNSPAGILWRLEGIDIPNPNHFAIIGSSGGGITVFSAQLLARSDFSTGGFAAEYGNAFSGVFDIHFRQGNFFKSSNRFRLSLLGIDLSKEGPIQKGRSSYLVNYRYSTLGLLSSMGIYLVGERVTNNFQDLSFNLVFKSKNSKSVHTFFGIGGLSEEHYIPVENPAERVVGLSSQWEDRVRPANMGALGWTWTYLPDDKSYLKTVVALVSSRIERMSDTLNREDERYRYDTQKYLDTRLLSSITYNRKLNTRAMVKTGLIFNQIWFDFFKSTRARSNTSNINQTQFNTAVQGSGNTQQFQQYAQLHYNLSDKLALNTGYHFLHLFANNSSSLEPRISLEYKPQSNQRLSLAYGLYGRALPLMAYYFTDTTGAYLNKNLKLLKAQHTILAYHFYTQNKMRIILEAYWQHLYNVPIRPDARFTYWMLNESDEFPQFKTVSQGKGNNYGIDAAIEKLFSNSWYFLINGSLMKGTFQTLNGETYNTRFNTVFSSSLSLGKEFPLRKGSVLQIGGRFLLNGGFRYTPHDPVKSAQSGRYEALAGADFAQQVPSYQRLDARIAYRFNKKKLAGNVSLDVQNGLNRINPSRVGYDAVRNATYVVYDGSGVVPVLGVVLDF